MPSIWDRVIIDVAGEMDQQIDDLRSSPAFAAMGSDIERAFAAWYVLKMRLCGEEHWLGLPQGSGYFLVPQHQIGQYRVDFVFGYSNGEFDLSKSIVIECDGHDFHERTKEQAARDKARDRFLSTKAGRVARFTGSEIYRNVGSCWIDALRILGAISGHEIPE